MLEVQRWQHSFDVVYQELPEYDMGRHLVIVNLAWLEGWLHFACALFLECHLGWRNHELVSGMVRDHSCEGRRKHIDGIVARIVNMEGNSLVLLETYWLGWRSESSLLRKISTCGIGVWTWIFKIWVVLWCWHRRVECGHCKWVIRDGIGWGTIGKLSSVNGEGRRGI